MARGEARVRTVALVATLAATTACSSSLVAGGLQAAEALLPISDAQEQQMGAQADQQLRAQTAMDANANLTAYVNQVGQKVAAVSDRTNIPYHFAVVQSTDLNAFSLPGGYVYVNSGLLGFMDNEAELAGVLGHEVGHVVHHDQINGVRQQLIAQGLTAAALGSNPGQLVQLGAGIAQKLILNGFGRDQEFGADQAGAAEMSKAGYDPQQMVAFFRKLQGHGDIPGWEVALSDHPTDADRITRVLSQIASQGLSGTTVDAQAYQQATAGVPRTP